jgi:hypothetical protein
VDFLDNQNIGRNNIQGQMDQPPNIISTKDLAYLTDALSWELLAFKKCHQFATMCSDSEIKQKLDQVGQMHQQHYGRLLNYLQSNPNQNYLQ